MKMNIYAVMTFLSLKDLTLRQNFLDKQGRATTFSVKKIYFT